MLLMLEVCCCGFLEGVASTILLAHIGMRMVHRIRVEANKPVLPEAQPGQSKPLLQGLSLHTHKTVQARNTSAKPCQASGVSKRSITAIRAAGRAGPDRVAQHLALPLISEA
jgi:hypothetical protein